MGDKFTYEIMQWESDALPIRVHLNVRKNKVLLFQPHWHKQIELMYILEGSIKLTCDNTEFIGNPGDILISNSNQVHFAESLSELVRYYILIIDYNIFHNYKGDILQSKYIAPIENNLVLFMNKIKNDHDLKTVVNDIIIEFQNTKPGYELAVKSAIYQLLVHLIRKYKDHQSAYRIYAKNRKKQEIFKEVFTFIDENFTHDISTTDLSKMLDISLEHFCREFKDLTGITLITYINRKKINFACKLLHNQENTILEIATKVGFSSSPYFCKVFKQHMQLTPTEYRESLNTYDPL